MREGGGAAALTTALENKKNSEPLNWTGSGLIELQQGFVHTGVKTEKKGPCPTIKDAPSQ